MQSDDSKISAPNTKNLPRYIAEFPKNTISWILTKRQYCDLELLLNKSFSPLKGFMCENEYYSVLQKMRLPDGTLWPIPINLDIDEITAKSLKKGNFLLLRNEEGTILASLLVKDIWKPNLMDEAKAIYESTNLYHAGVSRLIQQTNPWYVGGDTQEYHPIKSYDFQNLRYTPDDLKKEFQALGWEKIIAFQTRNPMHRVHYELTIRSLEKLDANLLIHPVVGETKLGDIEYYTRVRCYQAILPHYPKNKAMLALLPLAMRMAGPKEALWHAIIRKNYGCTHFIVGRDHAGPGNDPQGQAFYGHYAAQNLIKKYETELGISMVPFEAMQYVKNRNVYLTKNEVQPNDETLSISGTELRQLLKSNQEIPPWFTFPQVAKLLKKRYLSIYKQGLTIFFTGLSASGKSSLAQALQVKLLEKEERQVTLLDGDLVRRHLSSELGFSKEHRDLNILRIAYVASEITKHRGIAICSPIAPYDQVRQEVRSMIKDQGQFFLIHMSTPLNTCEERDCKGLYAKAREGILKNFTGISDPYEIPENADLAVDASQMSVEQGLSLIIEALNKKGYLQNDL
ncbi:MAG: sulfate adenylyltransferase [Chlamydiales bacterium]|jgi:sulfate adenylyltransferase